MRGRLTFRVTKMPEEANSPERTDQSLRDAYEQLQWRFQNQTDELRATQDSLRQQIAAHGQMEVDLQHAKKELQDQTRWHTLELGRATATTEAKTQELLRIADDLRASEERYRSLISLAPDSIATLDLRGRITSTNVAACGITGYTEDEILGKPFWELGVFRKRDIPKYLKLFFSLIRGNPSGPLELECYSKDGTQQTLESRVGFVRQDGRIVGLQVISRNITHRKSAEETHRREQIFRNRIIECASEGLCVCHNTPEHPYVAFTVWNSRMTDLTGYTMDEINRLGWYQTMYPDPNAQEQAIQRIAAMRAGNDLVDEEWEITRADGQRRNIHISTSVVVDEVETKHVLALMHDVTEHKLAREALRQVTERLTLATSAACIGIWDLDVLNDKLIWDDTMFRLYGVAPNEFSGSFDAWRSYVHPEDLPRLDTEIQLALKGKTGIDTEYRVVWPDSSVHWIKANATVERNDPGTPVRILGVNWDITSRKQAEESLHQSEARYRTVVEDQTDLISRLKADGTFVFVNDAYCRYFNKSRQELLGTQWQPVVMLGDVTMVNERLSTLSPSNPIVVIENRVHCGQGRIRWMQFVNRGFFDDNGRLVEIQSVGRDITERKQIEAALRASEGRCRIFIETIPQLAWHSSANGVEVDCNRRWYEYTGQTPAQVRAHGWLAAVHPDDLIRVTHETLRAANASEPYELEYRLRRASDGAYRWHLARAVPILDDNGEVVSWFGSATDIEDLKHAQMLLKEAHFEQLQRHQAELAHVARLSTMGEMAASLVHELNQPLHAVHNYVRGCVMRLQTMRAGDAELFAALEQVIVEANRAAEIVGRVKRFVQKRKLPFCELSVNRLVEEVGLLSKAELELRHTQLTLDLAENLPTVLGDAIQIEQVILNLLRNGLEAIDETPEDCRHLGIRTHFGEGDTVQVDVWDRGQGIDQDDLKQIFEPFFSTKPEGMGMGLEISRSIVREHGGRLWASVNRDQGCTFHVTLPVLGKRCENDASHRIRG